MFEAYSSREHQSAVERLIQMATGKKAGAPAIEEAPEPAGEPLQEQAAGTAAPEAASSESVVVEAGQVAEESTGEHPVHEEQVEPHHDEAAPVEAAVDAQAPVEEPALEAAVEPDHSAVAEVARTEAEPVAEPALESAAGEVREDAVEAVAADESALAAHEETGPEPQDVLEAEADEHDFHEETLDPALLESILAEHDTEVHAVPAHEPEVGAAATQSEGTGSESVVEAAAEPKPETAHEQTAAGEAPATEDAASGQLPHAHPVDEQVDDEMPEEPPTEEAGESATPEFYYAASKVGDEGENQEPYRLEKYMRRSLYRRTGSRADALDVVPAPDDTMFLKSKDLSEQPTEEELKELARDPMWKTLMQFKGWLPLVTRVLPLLDLAGNRGAQGMNRDVKESVDGLTVSQRELRVTLQDQTLELKRVEEEVSRLRDTAEKTAFEQTATADEVKALRRLLKNVFLYVGILLGLLVVAVGYMAFLVFTYLNTPTH